VSDCQSELHCSALVVLVIRSNDKICFMLLTYSDTLTDIIMSLLMLYVYCFIACNVLSAVNLISREVPGVGGRKSELLVVASASH